MSFITFLEMRVFWYNSRYSQIKYMKCISWNVNGIRSCVNKGFLEYLQIENPDIIGLQEVKAKEDQNPILIDLRSLGYEVYWHGAERP